jgi:hypothetical protein
MEIELTVQRIFREELGQFDRREKGLYLVSRITYDVKKERNKRDYVTAKFFLPL